MIERPLEAVDRRTGISRPLRAVLRYVFPDNWSFLWGEIALYCFVVLVVTGVYLTLFFDPSYALMRYHGSYRPLAGASMSHAYASTLRLSLNVRAGLLMRQTHHWAALVFLAAIIIHLCRVFFTGAFRRPRELIWMSGVTLLALAMLEGFIGYSLPDDLLSGMGLAIAYSVAMSIPIVGAPLAFLLWNGAFPGGTEFESRLYIAHVLLIPVALGALIGLHLLMVAALHHTQFRGRDRRESNVVGSPLWPAYALRSLGLFAAVAGAMFALGGLVQINPIWQYGPYDPAWGTNGVQPDWYMGWLIGALRLMPNIEPHAFGYSIPNPFFGGVLFPTVVFVLLYAWPFLERLVAHDAASHHLLDRPRDRPWRTAIGAAMLAWVTIPFLAGASDRVFVTFDIPYQNQIVFMRWAWLVVPVVVLILTLRACRRLQRRGGHPLRGWDGSLVRRQADGGFETLPPEEV